MQRGIDADDPDFGTSVFIGDAIERFKDGAGGCGDETRSNGREGNVDEEEVDERLRWSDHVFCRGDEFNDRVTQFTGLHTIERLADLRVIIKRLRCYSNQVSKLKRKD